MKKAKETESPEEFEKSLQVQMAKKNMFCDCTLQA